MSGLATGTLVPRPDSNRQAHVASDSQEPERTYALSQHVVWIPIGPRIVRDFLPKPALGIFGGSRVEARLGRVRPSNGSAPAG